MYLCLFACIYPSLSSVSVYLCVRVLISESSGLGHSLPLVSTVCTYSYDVDKVIFSQCVEDCVDGVFGNGQSEPLHTATDIDHDHYIFGRSGCLDIPGKRQQVYFYFYYNVNRATLMTPPDVIYQ